MKKGSEIFYNMILLTGANLLLRLTGMGFQVYLSRRIGAAGIGLLQLVLSVTAMAFTIGAAGAAGGGTVRTVRRGHAVRSVG